MPYYWLDCIAEQYVEGSSVAKVFAARARMFNCSTPKVYCIGSGLNSGRERLKRACGCQ
jgi:hypothetical protein